MMAFSYITPYVKNEIKYKKVNKNDTLSVVRQALVELMYLAQSTLNES
jgi:hypothetical protein